MATPIKSSLVDHSALDGTGDAINGSEVDENGNTLADLLDGTSTTVLGQAASVSFEAIDIFQDANAAGSIQDQWVYEWDPADGGQMTDNSSGLGMVWKMPDASDNQTQFANLDVVCVDDTASSGEEGEFIFSVALAGTMTEVLTLGSGAGTVFNEPGSDLDFRIETNNLSNGFVVDGGLDVFSFGAAAADDKFVTISPPAATHTADTDTYALHVTAGGAQTIPSGTTALVASVAVEEPNITATGTVTSAASLYVKSAPTEGGSNYALWVDAGAVQFDAGLTVGTDVTVGDDLLLNSDSAVLSLGAGADATLTHDGTTGLTIAANPITVDSGGNLTLDANTGIWIFKDAGTEMLRFTESSSGDVTIKLVTDAKDLVFSDNGNNVNMTILDAAVGINVPGEVQTTGIGYTDGDNAITIADGGGITAAAGITSTAASNTLGATSFNDANITNVGDIALDTISSDGSAIGIGASGDTVTCEGAWIFNEGSNSVDFRIEGNGEANLFVADASEDRIGIGTDTPDSLLDLSSSSHTEMHIQSTGTGVNTITFASTPTATDNRLMRLDAQWGSDIVARIHANTGNDTSDKHDGYLTFYTAEGGTLAERLRIEQDGKVGINDTSPADTFEVTAMSGVAAIRANAVTDQWAIKANGASGSTESFGLLVAAGTGTSDFSAKFRTYSGTDIFTIRGDGNVGIGETSPDQLLHIKSGLTNNNPLYIEHTDSTSPYGADVHFSGAATDDNTRWFLRARDNSANRCFIYSDGDLQNHDNAYGAISDSRLKSNIVYQTPEIRSYWQDWKRIKFAKFELNDDIEQYGAGVKGTRFGVIAQDMLTDWSGLVKSHYDERVEENRYGFNYSSFNTIGGYVLQEALQRIEALEARL
jgi:hypothetical protein